MQLVQPYDVVAQLHPEAIAEIGQQIRKSRSKAKSLPFDSLVWSYDWVVLIQSSGTLAAVFQQANNSPAPLTVEEELAQYKSNCRVLLKASHGRTSWFARLPEVPEAVLQPHREQLEKRAAEERRFDALTPEEQEAERQKVIADFMGMPGTLIVQIPARR